MSYLTRSDQTPNAVRRPYPYPWWRLYRVDAWRDLESGLAGWIRPSRWEIQEYHTADSFLQGSRSVVQWCVWFFGVFQDRRRERT